MVSQLKVKIWFGFLFLPFLLLIFSCKVDPRVVPELPSEGIAEIVPEGWPQPYYTFSTNPVTEPGFVLGRYLFYETLLSRDNTISCGSCHQIGAAFANTEHSLSHGINNQVGKRNAPGLFNLTWHTSFMHDGGINHIENQPPAPITNPVEMDEQLENVIKKLQATERYPKLFKEAFGNDSITTQGMMKAITQFQGLLYSYQSKYDLFKNGKVEFSESEVKGYQIFLNKCNACHKEPLFSDFKFRNNGLPVDPALNDIGRALVDKASESYYKFKTPSLRNIVKTSPYMHDGRFATLEACLDHYANGIKNLVNLDPLLQNGIQLNTQERTDLLNFLQTLTDTKFISDKRYMNPNFN
jgi:cytochrome c peroxidase